MADNTQNKPNERWWNGPNAAGGGRAPGDASGATGTDGSGPGTIYIGPHAFGVTRRQVGPNVAGAPRSVNND